MSHDAAPLFAGWEKGMILSCLQGHMGQVLHQGRASAGERPVRHRRFLLFRRPAGPALVRQADRPLLVPRTGDWAPVIRTVWGRRAVPFLRYALCGAPEDFDRTGWPPSPPPCPQASPSPPFWPGTIPC